MKNISIITIISIILMVLSAVHLGYTIGNMGKKEVQQLLDIERFSALRCQKIKGVLVWEDDLKRVFCWSNPPEIDIEQMKQKEGEYEKFNNYVCGEPSKRLLCK